MRYLQIIILIFLSTFTYSQLAITIPSEYEKSEKLLISWPYSTDIDTVTASITGFAKDFADIDILYNSNNATFDTTAIRNFLISMSATAPNVRFVPSISNTNLLRQYSPVAGYGVFSDDLVRYFGNPGFDNYNRPADDSIPTQLADYYGFELADYGIQFENSNIQYDGLRYLFVGDRIISDNVPMSETDIRFSLNAYFNSGEVMFIPTPENSGGGMLNSIENYIKLLDPETILVTSIPDTLPDYSNIEDIVEELSTITNYFGKEFSIIRIPAAPNADFSFTTSPDGEFRSYTNSIIINNLAIIPSFGLPEYDSAAYNIYKAQLPGYNIKLVNASALTPNHGGLHTITKGIPQHSFLRILHSKMTGVQEFYPEIKINTLCNTATQLENMWLYYKKNNDTAYTKKEIHLVCPQYFSIIEKVNPTDTIHYYIEANSSETQITYPLSAPEGNFTFWFDVISSDETVNNKDEFKIAPNPSTGSFIIRNNINENIKISIFNSSGQLVHRCTTITNTLIDLDNNLLNGYYSVCIETKEGISTHKLIIHNR